MLKMCAHVLYSVGEWRQDYGPKGTGSRAERHRVRGSGLRVQGEAGRNGRAGGDVVLQQQSQPRLPVDTRSAAPDHRAPEKPHTSRLRCAHGRRVGQVPRPVPHPADHRAERQLQVRSVHVQR